MAKLTKRDLTIRISNETGLIQQKVLTIIDLTLDHLIESLAQGQTIEFRKFGVFELRRRAARVGRNPNRPEKTVLIPPRIVVKFKAGKELKSWVKKIDHAQFNPPERVALAT